MSIKYSFRPAYGSTKLLIEFLSGVDEPDFVPNFMNAISEINPFLSGMTDLWMNDEVQMEFTSDIGAFTFSKDNWGYAFLEAPNNQPCLKAIDSLLSANDMFEKVAVDPADFK